MANIQVGPVITQPDGTLFLLIFTYFRGRSHCAFGGQSQRKNSTVLFVKKNSDFLTLLGPLGARPYRFEQKYSPNRLCVVIMCYFGYLLFTCHSVIPYTSQLQKLSEIGKLLYRLNSKKKQRPHTFYKHLQSSLFTPQVQLISDIYIRSRYWLVLKVS